VVAPATDNQTPVAPADAPADVPQPGPVDQGFQPLTSDTVTGPLTNALAAPTGHSFYVDCASGRDTSDGLAPDRAWATMARASKATLQPGDALLLKRGCTWNGPLELKASGTANQPIQVTAYGAGERPQIQNAAAQILVSGSYVVMDNLKVRSQPDTYDKNCRNNPIGNRTGVSFEATASNNTLQNSVISDLSDGVFFTPGSQNNHLLHNELSNNIMLFDLDPYKNDGGAQAVLVEGDNNEVAYNNIFGSLACSTRYGVDGTAIEIYGGRNTAIHHNMTWDNSQFAEVSLPRTTNNVFAYNIVNGHSGVTVHAGPTATKVYNNVFYSTGGSGDNGNVCAQCSPAVLTFKNNIVWGYGSLSTGGAPVDEAYNVYWAPNGNPFLDFPISSTSRVADPQFHSPGNDFHLQSTSPALNRGTPESIAAGFGLDLSGRPVGQRGAPSLGVYDLP